MMQIYHQFVISIRVGDLEIYISMLTKLASLFFTLNRHNYARWLVIYHDNLLNLKETHPQVHKDFICINHGDKSFSVKKNTKANKTGYNKYSNGKLPPCSYITKICAKSSVPPIKIFALITGLPPKEEIMTFDSPSQARKFPDCNFPHRQQTLC